MVFLNLYGFARNAQTSFRGVDGDPKRSGPGFGIQLDHDLLEVPRRWRKPRTIFVEERRDRFERLQAEVADFWLQLGRQPGNSGPGVRGKRIAGVSRSRAERPTVL